MPIAQVIEGRFPAKAWTKDIEDTALIQIKNLTEMPFIYKHIAVMPDCHAGYGSTVGSVIPTQGAIIPATVGVDIGCGMMAYRLNLCAQDLPDNLHSIRNAIENAIPCGRTDNGGQNDRGAWGELPTSVREAWSRLSTDSRWVKTLEYHPKIAERHINTSRHLGTLGTGNHFIEICLDENNDVWVMLHSGSRGVGNRIGTYFMQVAREDMRRFFINLPDADLAYFPQHTPHYSEYCAAVSWAQDYAKTNRELMMSEILFSLTSCFEKPISINEWAVNCHHNYVAWENHYGVNVMVTRKGAVRARKGDLGIIPGSMGAKSFIVEGLGNKESFDSCSHGAGRRMSRGKAKHTFTIEDLAQQTNGIECRKDIDVIDEIPGAYKDIDEVMANQIDLVKPLFTLKQVLCVKG
jgi:tRNA-splicing ligase RtcB (3'-phosphate/5'-hydroxy nucleic acid ligase)